MGGGGQRDISIPGKTAGHPPPAAVFVNAIPGRRGGYT